ncbi:acyl carrier protein [Aminipila sp.]|uniref:acyl carrier protein n=1 Tax=Aminipila sp. TaxID=2060095 RepID=UPI0028963C04|nr:acyl carrier protein [Aminipila sp.]
MSEEKIYILEIIKEINSYVDIAESKNLIEDGVLDSLSIIYLITQLEEKFNIEIPEEEYRIERFSTLNAIEELIQSVR